MSTCADVFRDRYIVGDSATCRREVDESGRHRGQHQAVAEAVAGHTWLVTWSGGGSSSVHYAEGQPPGGADRCMGCREDRLGVRHPHGWHGWVECAGCGVTMDRAGDLSTARGEHETQCGSCRYWTERVQRYGQVGSKGERFLVPRNDGPLGAQVGSRGWLYTWSPGHGGGFGGRRYVVTCDDGTTLGPADYLWSNGAVPWWLVDELPPNCTIAADVETPYVRRPGYTSAQRGRGRPLDYNAAPEPARRPDGGGRRGQ